MENVRNIVPKKLQAIFKQTRKPCFPAAISLNRDKFRTQISTSGGIFVYGNI